MRCVKYTTLKVSTQKDLGTTSPTQDRNFYHPRRFPDPLPPLPTQLEEEV